MSPIEYFVQSALPVLMEIVKKGGRYTEASISKLRPSFKVLFYLIVVVLYMFVWFR